MAIAGPSRLPNVAAGFTIASTLIRKRHRCVGEGDGRELNRSSTATTTNAKPDDVARTVSLVHLDHPARAVKCLCIDVRLMRLQPCAGSIRTFLHVQRQTIFAHVVGIIVGVEEKDRKVTWLVDDGSAVIAVHYVHNTRPVPRVRREAAETAGQIGIPSRYVRPMTPPPAAKEGSVYRTETDSNHFSKSIAHLEVCGLVSVVGRIDVRFGNERILHVDRVIPDSCKADDHTCRSERDGYIVAVEDINEEARHALLAVSLAESEYRSELQVDATAGAEDPLRALHYGKTSAISNPRMLLRPLNGGRRVVLSKEKGTIDEKPSSIPLSEDGNLPDEFTPPPKRSRRLRDYRKLPEQQLTEQLLRVYVQKHIHDHCTGAHSIESDRTTVSFTVSYLMKVANLYGLARRVVEREREKQRRRRLRSGKSAAKAVGEQRSQEDEASKIRRLFDSVVRAVMLDGMLVLADKNACIAAPFDGRKPEAEVLANIDPDKLLHWEADDQAEERDDDGGRCDSQGACGDQTMMKWRGKIGKEECQEAYQVVTPGLLAGPIIEHLKGKLASPQAPSSYRRMPRRLGASVHARLQSTHPKPTGAEHEEGKQRLLALIKISDPIQILEHLRRSDDRWQYLQRDTVIDCIAHLSEQNAT